MSQNLIDELNQMKEEFYSENGKNSFFKKKQKEECARKISAKYTIEQLAQATIYIIPDTNRVYFDYTIFKLFANPDNFAYLTEYIIYLFSVCIEQYGNFIVDFNLDTFTVSAAERYKNVVGAYCDACRSKDTDFVNLMVSMNLYNTPSVIDMIKVVLKPVADPNLYVKLKSYSKEESPAVLSQMFPQTL